MIARMALEALNLSHRERELAKRLFEQWLIENQDLRVAIADRAIAQSAARAIAQDLRIENKDVLRTAERMPLAEDGVPVGAEVVPPRTALLPMASPEAEARRAARLTKHLGLLGWRLPNTDLLLGDAPAWEVKRALGYHWDRARGETKMAQFFALIWASLPDRNKPASRQKPVKEHMDRIQLQRLWNRAKAVEAKRTLSLGKGAA